MCFPISIILYPLWYPLYRDGMGVFIAGWEPDRRTQQWSRQKVVGQTGPAIVLNPAMSTPMDILHLPATDQYWRITIRQQENTTIVVGVLVYWGLTPQQQPGSYQGGEMMMMKSVFWWRKPEYPEKTTDLRCSQ